MKPCKSQVLRNWSLELRKVLRVAEHVGRKEQRRSSPISMSSFCTGGTVAPGELSLLPGHLVSHLSQSRGLQALHSEPLP